MERNNRTMKHLEFINGLYEPGTMYPDNRRFQLGRLRQEGVQDVTQDIAQEEEEMFEMADFRADEHFKRRNECYKLLFGGRNENT